MNTIPAESWKQDLPAFREKTEAFYAGELDKAAYKGFSGLYGSYAQKGGTASMLRLRMTAGRVTREKLAFIADAVKRYSVPRMHFTTCEAIQLHDLNKDQTCAIMEEALDHGIVTMGGGGDFPRNVMCAPLSGVDPQGYFDVLPWAEAAAEYLMGFVKAEKMPRKLKVCFSDSPANIPHATFRDLGFVARPDGKFDVYSAGGLGNNAKFGVKMAEAVEPEKILYYIRAMWQTFRKYGNYENRGKARTRYMQEACGGEDAYREAYLAELKTVLESGEDLDLSVKNTPCTKKGDGTAAPENRRVLPQKQEGLYAVAWHPIGGVPSIESFCRVAEFVLSVEGAELRIAPDETVYLINLTGAEAEKALEVTADGAQTLFETSVSCIGGQTCQVGMRDSQGLLAACIEAVRKAKIADGVLPQIHISGCPSSCGTHQTGPIGFRGASKVVDGKPASAFMLFVGGCDRQGEEKMGREVGVILEEQVPQFLVELGQTISFTGLKYDQWVEKYSDSIDKIAKQYL